MKNADKPKPMKFWPVWILFGVSILLAPIINPMIPAYTFWGCIAASMGIHVQNKKKFGKEYWKKPKQ